MKKIIFGNMYNYSIELIKDRKFYFEIWAKFKNTNQISTITNLNCIISELSCLLLNIQNNYETTWELDNIKDANMIYKNAISIFKSNYFINYLERKLDEDRELGGWNSENKF